jgi:hypothetical protein
MRLTAPIIAVALAGVACTRGGGKQLVFDDSRPLARAVVKLQPRFAVPIAYEDPRYSFHDDIEDVARSVRKDLGKYPPGHVPPVLIPKIHQLVVEDESDPMKALRSLLGAEERAGVVFELRDMKQMYAIVPSRIRGRDGSFQGEAPVLDARITIADGERTVTRLLHEVCSAVTGVTGTRVLPGIFTSGKRFDDLHIRTSAIDKPAREVLQSALAGTVEKPYWLLYYDIDSREFVLHIRDSQSYIPP